MKVFHQLVWSALQRYGPQLHRYLLRRWHNRQGVPDLMQEIYLKLVRMDPDQPPPEEPLAYLYEVANSVLANQVGAEARHAHVVAASDALEDWANDPNQALPDDLMARLDLKLTLERALLQLPQKEANILVMRFQEGLTYKEIAARTGLSVKSIDKYITRGKSRMYQALWKA